MQPAHAAKQAHRTAQKPPIQVDTQNYKKKVTCK